MIGRLKGTLVSKQPPWLTLDVHGVGYELEAPMSTFYELPPVGGEVVLCTHYAAKEDSVALYGFHREAERLLFRTLLKVSGIGAKTALSILSGVSVDEFSRLVQTSDIAALTRVPGIGKKTAERIVVELRDRVDGLGRGIGGGLGGATAMPMDPASEAIVALQALGYKPQEAARLVKQVAAEQDDAEAIIRKALKAALR
ncbi:MAG TPA: Holliday junction branch migration protein RuvA [Pseudomonadota bacterium]|nr:Holliday junction branch migration protein RuvA [Pseudomonadota bacterium]HQX24874.1 Holliday junction branch migration protein RuvA [Pseudomonadota bacterium]